ncbi:MAG: GldG family protein, partial [Polaromonas sp.]
MEASYKRFAPAALFVGLLGFLAAAGIWLVQRQFDTAVQAALAVGLLGLAVAILLNPNAVQVWLRGRQARYGGNVAIMLVALVGILVLVNYLVVKNPQRWDMTENKINTLAPETEETLKQLAQPVTAIGFYTARFASAQDSAKNLLEQYRIASDGKFTYEFHDPEGDPTLARKYEITRDGTIVLLLGENKEEINSASEDLITGALVRLAHPGTRTVYFITGHGEHAIDGTDEAGLSTVADLLTKQNYDLKPLDLNITTTVPSDARAVVLAGPLVPMTQAEVDKLKAYLDQGGAMVVMLDPLIQTQTPVTATEPLVDYLAQGWGLRVDNDVIVDLYNSFSGQPYFPTDSDYGTSPITARLQNIKTVFPVARSVGAIEGTGLPGNNYVSLITVDARAWGETDFNTLSGTAAPTQDATDLAPPLNVAETAENTTTKSRVVFFGDEDFASNTFANQGANGNLFVSAVNWATVEESLINLT